MDVFASFSLLLMSHPRAIVCVCYWMCIALPFFLQKINVYNVIRVHSLVCLFSWCSILMRVFCTCVCLYMVVPFFLHQYSSDFIWVHSLMCLFFRGHIPERICAWLCPSFCSIIDMMGPFASFFLLLCVRRVFVCVRMAVPFFMYHYLSNVILEFLFSGSLSLSTSISQS